MACELGLEYCTSSCGCANCVHNTSRCVHNTSRGIYVVTPEDEKRNTEMVANMRDAEKKRHIHFINEILPHAIFRSWMIMMVVGSL